MEEEEEGKPKVLIIGATGHLGQWIAKAAIALLHPTFALIRPATISANPPSLQSLTALGITVLEGSLEDYHSLVHAIQQVDIVISAVKGPQVSDQLNIVSAIKEVGMIKRFLPSEFGVDVDRAQALPCIQQMFKKKAQIRRAIEEARIPYTYICSFCFADYFVRNLAQPGRLSAPPTDKVIIHGNGNTKAAFLCEEDIGVCTITAADDPRTMNKVIHLRFPANILSQNEMVAMWESKVGKMLDKVFISEDEMIEIVEAQPFTFHNAATAMKLAIFVKGNMYNFQIGEHDVEASSLYPTLNYTTVDDYLRNLLDEAK